MPQPPNPLADQRVRSLLKRIHAPLNVGVPPTNAYKELMVMPDGEIRHYGFCGAHETGEGIYLASRDCGLSWQEFPIPQGCLGASVQSPWSGDWLVVADPRDEYLIESKIGAANLGAEKGIYVCRSTAGPEGPFTATKVADERDTYPRLPIPLRSRKRWLFTCQTKTEDGWFHPVVHYSDDDGASWGRTMLEAVGPHEVKWPHQGVRWQNYSNEPTVVELSSGRLWMLIRTSQDHHYESFSDDAGQTWTTPAPSRFYATITMPTLFRLRDGRIILFWCNTTPLPELDHETQAGLNEWERRGFTEDVFTNRDAIHAAISADDGQTWAGFREINLNDHRNDHDFRTSGGNTGTLDKSMHQSQAIELPEGKVLLSHGQHPLCRRLVIFDPAWLYEKQRQDDFRYGLTNWCTFQYAKGLLGNFRGPSGHCAYNRRHGAQLIPAPDGEWREVLQIALHPDPRLVHEQEGAVWNFPAAKSGTLQIDLRLPAGSQGLRISLVDRWFNPVDPVAHHFAQYVLEIDAHNLLNKTHPALPGDTWLELLLEWADTAEQPARCCIKGQTPWQPLPLVRPSVNGCSYLHLQTLATAADFVGVLIRSVAVNKCD